MKKYVFNSIVFQTLATTCKFFFALFYVALIWLDSLKMAPMGAPHRQHNDRGTSHLDKNLHMLPLRLTRVKLN